jgi:hypothetical protein
MVMSPFTIRALCVVLFIAVMTGYTLPYWLPTWQPPYSLENTYGLYPYAQIKVNTAGRQP